MTETSLTPKEAEGLAAYTTFLQRLTGAMINDCGDNLAGLVFVEALLQSQIDAATENLNEVKARISKLVEEESHD